MFIKTAKISKIWNADIILEITTRACKKFTYPSKKLIPNQHDRKTISSDNENFYFVYRYFSLLSYSKPDFFS